MGAVRIRHSIREIATQPVILWILLGGKPKWLPLNFGFNDVMRTAPIAFSTTCTKGHVVEKAIGVTHIEMKIQPVALRLKSPFFESARFFVSYNLHSFFVPFICLARPWNRFAYGVICLASSLKRRHGERRLTVPRCPQPRRVTQRRAWARTSRAEPHVSVTLWALLLIPRKTQASQ